ERNHDLEVLEPELLARAADGLRLEEEAFLVSGMVIARRAAPTDHWIFLAGLELPAAEERRVLVRLEIGEPQDDRLGMEGGGDDADSLGKLVDEVLGLVGVAPRNLLDVTFRLGRQLVEAREGERMEDRKSVV